ncbi:hypothetical protein AKJ16_DCAP02349 [Drosera capensis]
MGLSSLDVGINSKGVSWSDVGNDSMGVNSSDMGNNSKGVSSSDMGNNSKGVNSSDVGINSKGVNSSDVGMNSKDVSSPDVEVNVNTPGVSVDEMSLPELKVGRDVVVRYNKAELDASLEVIKKVMKMDAAEPFNAPVNLMRYQESVPLRNEIIPEKFVWTILDYYDVIDTPMDFGTMRSNLESGSKYLNSEDVYRMYNTYGLTAVNITIKAYDKASLMQLVWEKQALTRALRETLHAEDGALSSHEKNPKKGKGYVSRCRLFYILSCKTRPSVGGRSVWHVKQQKLVKLEVKMPMLGRQPVLIFLGSLNNRKVYMLRVPLVAETSSYLETSPDLNAEDIEDDRRLEETGTPQIDAAQKEEADAELHDEDDRSGDISEKLHHHLIAVLQKMNPIQLLSQDWRVPQFLEWAAFSGSPATECSHDSGIHEAVASFMNSSSRTIRAREHEYVVKSVYSWTKLKATDMNNYGESNGDSAFSMVPMALPLIILVLRMR